MPTYRTGTIALTAASATVTGTGTAWVGAIRDGQMLQVTTSGQDPTDYEVASVASNTSLVLERPWGGATGAGRAYQVKPASGATQRLADNVQALLDRFEAGADAALAGIVGPGSLAAPGLRFAGDLDTGLWSPAANTLGFVTGGVERMRLTAAGLLTGAAVQASPVDATAGRLLTAGAGGLLGPLPVIGNAGVVDNGIAPGFYRYDTSASSTGGPAGVSLAMVLHTRRGPGGGEHQLWIVEDGTAFRRGALLTRARQTGAWGAMLSPYPEVSTNANGTYVRHLDGSGRLECYAVLDDTAVGWTAARGGLFARTSERTWVYPFSFLGTTKPVITAGADHGADVMVGCGARSVGPGSVLLNPYATSAISAGVGKAIHAHAAGFWS